MTTIAPPTAHTVPSTLAKKPFYPSKMNADIKTKWLEALRSGNYHQSRSALRRDWAVGKPSGFCCLGVLCAIGEDMGAVESADDGGFRRAYKLKGADEVPYGMMPTEGIKNWAGLTQVMMDDLADMNDSQGKNFAQIANFIEEHL